MAGVLERSLGILELLSHEVNGLSVSAIAGHLNLPVSAAHRLLNELARFGYVRQDKAQGDYALTVKLASLGLSFLGRSGIVDIAQPILDRLASTSGELIRLSVLDGRDLIWIAVAQGATTGLRYDPGQEHGMVIHLASTANGLAYLATMTDEEALTLVAEQGFAPKAIHAGAKSPATARELIELIHETRAHGYAVTKDSYILGMSAVAVPIRYGRGGKVIGTVSIAGPAARLDDARIEKLLDPLRAAALELGEASSASRFFASSRQSPVGRPS